MNIKHGIVFTARAVSGSGVAYRQHHFEKSRLAVRTRLRAEQADRGMVHSRLAHDKKKKTTLLPPPSPPPVFVGELVLMSYIAVVV